MTDPNQKPDGWSQGLNLWGKVMVPLVVMVGIGVLVASNIATERERTVSRRSDVWFDLLNLVTRSHPVASQTAFVTAWVLIGVFVALILGGSQFAFTKTPEKHVPWREREEGAAPRVAVAPTDQPPHGRVAPADQPADRPLYGTVPAERPAYGPESTDRPAYGAEPTDPQPYGRPPADGR